MCAKLALLVKVIFPQDADVSFFLACVNMVIRASRGYYSVTWQAEIRTHRGLSGAPDKADKGLNGHTGGIAFQPSH